MSHLNIEFEVFLPLRKSDKTVKKSDQGFYKRHLTIILRFCVAWNKDQMAKWNHIGVQINVITSYMKIH